MSNSSLKSMRLSDKDAQMLATLYEMPHWNVFRRILLEQKQLELAQIAPFLPTMEAVAETRGKIIQLKDIEKEMLAINERQSNKGKIK